MKRRTVLWLAAVGIAAAMGAGWAWRTGALWAETMPQFVRAFVGESAATDALELQGNVEVREVRLRFEVPGRIASLVADEGDAVAPGQLLAKLEPDYFGDTVRQAEAELEARDAELLKLRNGSRPEELEQAKANVKVARVAYLNAQKDFRRRKSVVSNGAVSQEDFDSAEARLDQAEAQLQVAEAACKLVEIGPRKEDISRAEALVRQAQARLDEARRRLKDSELFAPSCGIVQTRVHEVGDCVRVGEPVYTISITDPVWVRAYVDEVDLGRIRPGMKAVVVTDGGKSYEGRIGFISPVAEFTPKTVETKNIRTDLVYRIRVIVPNAKNELRQGMPVTLRPVLAGRGEE